MKEQRDLQQQGGYSNNMGDVNSGMPGFSLSRDANNSLATSNSWDASNSRSTASGKARAASTLVISDSAEKDNDSNKNNTAEKGRQTQLQHEFLRKCRNILLENRIMVCWFQRC
jgi:hypothetical protein